VYYKRSLIAYSVGGPSPQFQTVTQWVDPSRARLLLRVDLGSQQGFYLQRESRDFFGGTYYLNPTAIQTQPQTLEQSRILALYCAELLRDGFGGVGSAWLARATSPTSRVWLSGRPALRVAMRGEDDPDMEPNPDLAAPAQHSGWIDATTHVPLRRQVLFADGTTGTERIILEQRLAPYTLPADFFDPPNPHPNLWDRALGWVRDRRFLRNLAGAKCGRW
jgi:hypothetical protein